MTVQTAIATFGASAKQKLSNPAATGQALLEKICGGPIVSNADLQAAGAFELPARPKRR